MTIRHKTFAANSVLKADDVNLYWSNQAVVQVDAESELSSLPNAVKLAFVLSTGRVFGRDASNVWAKIAGPRELIYENGNLGNSGLVNVGATAVVAGIAITSPATAATGQVHYTATIASSQGSGAGFVDISYNGVTYSQIYNVPTSGHPVVVNMPMKIASGQATFTVALRATAGFSTGVSYSSLRVTI